MEHFTKAMIELMKRFDLICDAHESDAIHCIPEVSYTCKCKTNSSNTFNRSTSNAYDRLIIYITQPTNLHKEHNTIRDKCVSGN